MAGRRKTKSERECDRIAEEMRIWERFKSELSAAKDLGEAAALASRTPGQSSPGRKFYSNLGFFLQSLMVPAGSSFQEKALYLGLLQRTAETVGPPSPIIVELEKQLRNEMERQGPF